MTVRMPEWTVLVRLAAIGFACEELFVSAVHLGIPLAERVNTDWPWLRAPLATVSALILVAYCLERGAHDGIARLLSSRRLDLLIAICAGGAIDLLLANSILLKSHGVLQDASPIWALTILLAVSGVLAAPLVASHRQRRRVRPITPYFVADEEILAPDQDLLGVAEQAQAFAQAVISSGTQRGIVFGLDGPWGAGKSSFINLAQRHWANDGRIVVCRFEPLRHAHEGDMTQRILGEIVKAIQGPMFAPEFRPVASRYARMLNGKAELSFLGLKFSVDPSLETADDLLDDIDAVLDRIDRRLVLVVDDLDRLDSKAISSVLFATRRTFRLARAHFVLSYDTEMLARLGGDSLHSREFLEKFVTVKLSLLVDRAPVQKFLRGGWSQANGPAQTMTPESRLQLASLLSTAADLLGGDAAASYRPLIGDIRKAKRFINSIRMLQIERIELERTGFEIRDLIHLLLINIHYPGIFRQIYAEETEGRSGSFSLKIGKTSSEDEKADKFSNPSWTLDEPARFLLRHLFDPKTLGFESVRDVSEEEISSRACFNEHRSRALERFLTLIVRVIPPPVQETYALYKEAVEKVARGTDVTEVLSASDFDLTYGVTSHDQFWRVLVDSARELGKKVAENAIDSLIRMLPRYPSVAEGDRALRQRAIYSLILLLDRAGWSDERGAFRNNSPGNIAIIADRIFGIQQFSGRALLDRLASVEAGMLGWYDLMLFRLQCSADRQGQLFNLQSALVLERDPGASRGGPVNALAIGGMRKISQVIFSRFSSTFIEPGRNFYTDAMQVTDAEILGDAGPNAINDRSPSRQERVLNYSGRLAACRTTLHSFVIYQLANKLGPTGAGVGCGYYDEQGEKDAGGIAEKMNEYVFDHCFNPEIEDKNALHFLDHCLAHLTSPIFSARNDGQYIADERDLLGGLDSNRAIQYWKRHGRGIRVQGSLHPDRTVVTYGYIATYSGDLEQVYAVLDNLVTPKNS